MKKSERGFSLLMAFSVVTFLLVGAAALFEQASGDLLTASGTNVQEQVRLLADLGSQWGQNALISMLYNNGTSTTPISTGFSNLTQLGTSDPMCPDGTDCSQFLLLSNPNWISTANGMYRVGVSCQPGGCLTNNLGASTFYLRVQALLTMGRQSIVETTLGYTS